MKLLHQRLTTLDQQGVAYELDYITMQGTGFVYRKAVVTAHDENSIIIEQEGYPETVIQTSSIASVRITTL